MSDRMTDHHTLALWGLALESEIAGYLTLVAPVYVLSYLRVKPTMVTGYVSQGTGLLLFAMTQAPLMIGVALSFAKREHLANATD